MQKHSNKPKATNRNLQLTLLLLGLSALNSTTAFAQGSLTPPVGAPAPVMRSLDQIEARIPISDIPFTITNSGSYFATTNLVTASNGAGIFIATNDVTLDLNGFTLTTTHVSSGQPGIHFIAPVTNITIMNGSISRFAGGIFSFPTIRNVQVSRIQVHSVSSGGISLDALSSTVENCSVSTSGATGISAAVVENCTVLNSAGIGINAKSVANCYVSGAGLDGINATTVLNSTGASSAAGYGIIASDSAMNSRGQSVSGVGLKAAVAMNCTGQRANGRAIEATVANGCYALSGTNLITYKYNMP